MVEMISLIFFGFIVYACLVVVPSIVEMMSTESFKASYFAHLASKYLHSYGK